MRCCVDPNIIEAIDSLNARFLGLYPVDSATLLIQRKMSALEKLHSIPVGRYIKLSDCNTFDIIYFIFRTDENSYMVAKREPVNAFKQKDAERYFKDYKRKKKDWEFCDRIGGWSAGLEAHIWVKQEKLSAEDVLRFVDPHNILSHELYEFKSDIHIKKV